VNNVSQIERGPAFARDSGWTVQHKEAAFRKLREVGSSPKLVPGPSDEPEA
jgi:hypothetical protein